jgi:hypothetical protein
MRRAILIGAVISIVPACQEPTFAADRALPLPPIIVQNQQACLVGRSEETLALWSHKTGQIPLLGFDVTLGNDVLPAWLLANPEDGSVAVLYRAQNGLTCAIVVGTDARPTPKLPALELPEDPTPGGPEL